MKKILFCIQWYPSYDSANTYCDEQIIKALQSDEKYEIHCLTYKRLQDNEYEVLEKVKIHRFKRSWFWTWYIDQTHNKKFFSSIAEKISRCFLRLKQIITIPLYPIYEPIQCIRFAYYARKLHKREKFDIVVSEFHGMDSLLAGLYLKIHNPSIKFVPIYWDSLAGGYLPKYLPEFYSRKRRIKLEHKISIYADKIIAIKYSRKIYDILNIKLTYIDKICFLDIPRVDLSKAIHPKPLDSDLKLIIEPSAINVIFAGSLGKRDVSYLFSLLNDLGREVNLIMLCNKLYHSELHMLSKRNPFITVKILEYLPYDKLSQLLCASNILLNLGNENPYLVPSKIYDYISYAKPIISICNIDDDTSKLVLSNYPAALIIDERESKAYNLNNLKQFLDVIDLEIDLKILEKSYFNATGKAYADILRTL